MWFCWKSPQSFDIWHDAVCLALGIPHPNRNVATDEIDESAQWTTAYTEAIVVAEDDVRAYVEVHVAELVSDGLGVPSGPPPPPKPFDSWLLDEDSCLWQPPTPYPDDGEQYMWDETTVSWVQSAE
jgi:hypothetical protein